MFYVVKKGEELVNYHSAFHDLPAAMAYADGLKATLGHDYDVIKVKTVWTTTTLADLLTGDAA